MVKHGIGPRASLDSAPGDRDPDHTADEPRLRAPEAPMTQVSTTRSFDPELTGYQYPRAVQFYESQAQAQTLRMAYSARSRRAATRNQCFSLCFSLMERTSPVPTGEPTIRELLREGFRVIAPDQIGFGKSSKPHYYQFTDWTRSASPTGRSMPFRSTPHRCGSRGRPRSLTPTTDR
jgi:hypothetical protein